MTVPPLTVPAVLVTVAESATLWLFGLYVVVWLLAAIVVPTPLIVNVPFA